MSRELTWSPLDGAVYTGQMAPFTPVSYQRLFRVATLTAETASVLVGGLRLQFKLDGTLQSQIFTLAQGVVGPFQIAFAGNGLLVGTSVVPQAVVVSDHTGDQLATVQVGIESDSSQTGNADVWIVPTLADLQAAINSAEYADMTANLLQDGQADPVPAIIANCASEVRAAIRAGRRNSLGPVGTIPSEAMNLFLERAQYFFYKRVKATSIGEKQLEAMRVAAETTLREIRNGEHEYIEPTTALETAPSGAFGSETYVESDVNACYTGDNDLNPNSPLPDIVGVPSPNPVVP